MAMIRKMTLVLMVCSFLTYSCNRKRCGEYISIAGETQGTSYHITYCSKGKVNYQDEIEGRLAAFDTIFSTYNEASLITRINKSSEAVKVNDEFIYLYQKAKKVWEMTGGAFDPTVGPLVNAWGFGPEMKLNVDSSKIDSLLEFTGFKQIHLRDDYLVKDDPRVYLDVNGIAQGYAVDLVAGFFNDKGVDHYLVEIGGEVRVKGKNKEGRLWRIGVDKPKENNMYPGRELQVVLSLDNKSLSTSGNYRKFYEKDGVKYTHSINPKTGMPVKSRLLSVTVLHDKCIISDAFATAFMIAGIKNSLEMARKNDAIEAFFIYSGENGAFQTTYTDGFEDIIQK